MFRKWKMDRTSYRSGQTCKARIVEYFEKICDFKSGNINRQSFEQEVRNQRFANEHGVGPKLISHTSDDESGTILMEVLDGYQTLESLCERKDGFIDKEVYDNLLTVLLKMLRAGGMHMDINHGNVMIEPRSKAVQLIDFEHVQYFDPNESLRSDKTYSTIPFISDYNPTPLTIQQIITEALTSFTGDIQECNKDAFSGDVQRLLSTPERLFSDLDKRFVVQKKFVDSNDENAREKRVVKTLLEHIS